MAETVQVQDAADLICNLKSAVAALECQYKMNVMEENLHRNEKKAGQPPMFIMIPLEQKRNGDGISAYNEKTRRKNRHDRVSDDTTSTFSLDCRKKGFNKHGGGSDNTGPGLRGGVLHSRCGCLHRDGLQDSCPLAECQGQPACMTKPWPTCPPAKYYRSHFPEIWP